jgi:hypothetical protein
MHCVPSYQLLCWIFLPFFWHQKAHDEESGVRLPSGSHSGGSASVAAVVVVAVDVAVDDDAADDEDISGEAACGEAAEARVW